MSGGLVLGIGNLLWADEGFGVRAVEALHDAWDLPPEVIVCDGGTQGLYLTPLVAGCGRLVVFDAVEYGLAPGTLKLIRNHEVPSFMGAKKMSLHQTGFQEVLAAASLLGDPPTEILLIGVQPADLETWGGSLSPAVTAALPTALEAALAELTAWGISPRPRRAPAPPLLSHGLGLSDYERPIGCR